MELGEEDRPPEEIWLDTEALDEWFSDVKARWSAKANGENWEPVSDRPMTENELAKEWRRA